VAEGTVTDAKAIQLKEFQKLDLKLKDGKVGYKGKHLLKAVTEKESFGVTAVGVDGLSKIR
jgi:hypothetical protein